MMKQPGYIEHKGTVRKVVGNKILVNLPNDTSCASCHVNHFCNVSDIDDKTVEVRRNENERVHEGDKVTINYERSMGPKALFLGYILPFFLVLAVLLVTMGITGNEGLAGLLSLLILVPYYLALYIFRDNLKTKFAFKIKSIKELNV